MTLTLAHPNALREEEGIPEDAELVHKRMLVSRTRRAKFREDLEKIKEAAEIERLATYGPGEPAEDEVAVDTNAVPLIEPEAATNAPAGQDPADPAEAGE